MKRLIDKLSFLLIVIATAILVIGLSIPINSNKPAVAFEYFPFNEPQTINFQAKADSLHKFTERQKKDQFLDWLLFTIESDRSFSTKDISEASYDISPVRYDYLKPVSNFEYGDTRSLYVGKETIVALIPQDSSSEQRIDYLAHIADKYRQNLGRIPEKLEIFEYQLDLEAETAQLTRIEELKTIDLFHDKKYGYYGTYIRNLDDLNQFMAKVDDITFAQVIDSDLVVGGRKIKSHSYGKISVEDVAALWQSEYKIQKASKDLEALKTLWESEDKIQQEIAAIQKDNSRSYLGLLQEIDPRFYDSSYGKQLLSSNISIKQELQKKYDKEFKAINLFNGVDGSGFSLDPAYDYQGLKESLANITSQLLALKSNDKFIFTNQEIEQAQKSLSQKNIVPYLKLIKKFELKQNEILFSIVETSSPELLEEIYDFLQTPETLSFQTARYDGYLEGTEVGMVLFYTDLLAKLWMDNYLGTTPEQYIKNFQPQTKIAPKVSSIYKHEIEKQNLNSTRLWFDRQDKEFQITNNSILFARNATRIFAASSNSLEPGKETSARADSEAFLGWWDEHYEEIARYEPQYERLNEIMKWSLVISWLNESEQGELLGFLQGVQVNHDNWFADWVQANIKQLKFKEWDTTTCSEDFYNSSEQPEVCFYPRGYKDTTTEAMPLLSSESFLLFGKKVRLSGGVSLGNRKIIADRIPLPKATKISDRSLRGNIDYKSVKVNNKILSFNTLDGATYNLQIDSKIASVIAKAKNGTKFRNLDSELINVEELVRQISRTNNGITINAVAGDTNIGSFSSSKTGNAFTVGWHSRDIDMGQSLALELSYYSRYDDFETILIDHPKVNSVAKPKDSPVYYVKTNNSEKWLKLSSGGDGGEIPPDYTFRVASTEPPEIPDPWFIDPSVDSESLLLGWVDDLDDLETQVIFSRSKHKKSSISEDIRNGDYIVAAPKIIRQKKLNKALTEINSLMKSQDYEKAAKLVDDFLNRFGQEPDLMVRKAVVNIKLKRLKVKAASIEGLETPNDAYVSDKFDELNEILENSDKGKFKAIEKDDAFIYVHDTPELNNIDWSNPIENSISSVSSKTRVYKLQDGDVGNINLDDFFVGNGASLPPGGGKGGGRGGDNKSSKSSDSGKYNNNQYYRGSFLRSNQSAQSYGECELDQENKTKTTQCIKEKNGVYIMYTRN